MLTQFVPAVIILLLASSCRETVPVVDAGAPPRKVSNWKPQELVGPVAPEPDREAESSLALDMRESLKALETDAGADAGQR